MVTKKQAKKNLLWEAGYMVFSFIIVSIALSALGGSALLYAASQIKADAKIESKEPSIEFTATRLSSKQVLMTEHASEVLKFKQPVTRTALGNADIVDMLAISPTEVLLVAKDIGSTSLVVWEAGGLTEAFEVIVDRDPRILERLIADVREPDSEVHVETVGDTLALVGVISSNEERLRLMQVAEGYAEGAIDMMTIREPKQILIDVYFVEFDRTNSDDYGQSISYFRENLNLYSFAGNVAGQALQEEAIGATNSDITSPPFAISESSTFDYGFSDGQHFISHPIEWMESHNYLKVIAKPKLLAKDGEEAEFLVGGEFPFATASSNGTTIQFREFGHQLKFTPNILKDGRIRLTVESAVSELNFTSTLTISGFTLPSITENSARTIVELKNHQTLVLGGFLSTRKNDVETKVPVLGDMPVLGKLFRSKDNEEREHELMFIITPHVIEPVTLEGAEKADDFYDGEQLEKILNIDDLPDADMQMDLLRDSLNNYQSNRLLAQADLNLPTAADPLGLLDPATGSAEIAQGSSSVLDKLFEKEEVITSTGSKATGTKKSTSTEIASTPAGSRNDTGIAIITDPMPAALGASADIPVLTGENPPYADAIERSVQSAAFQEKMDLRVYRSIQPATRDKVQAVRNDTIIDVQPKPFSVASAAFTTSPAAATVATPVSCDAMKDPAVLSSANIRRYEMAMQQLQMSEPEPHANRPPAAVKLHREQETPVYE